MDFFGKSKFSATRNEYSSDIFFYSEKLTKYYEQTKRQLPFMICVSVALLEMQTKRIGQIDV